MSIPKSTKAPKPTSTKKKLDKIIEQKVDKLESIARSYSGYELYNVDKLITKEQCAFLAVLEKNLGNLSHAQRSVGVKSRQTIYNWKESNIYFAAAFDEIREQSIDEIESKLKENALNGNVIAQMFYLKTIGKSRGYIERVEQEQTHELVGFEFVEAQ